MKKIKLLMLVIVMLLNNLQSLVLANDNVIPSTGDLIQTDTAVAVIPIYLIKQSNVKMIERLYLLEINKQQDSIIQLKEAVDLNYSDTVSVSMLKLRLLTPDSLTFVPVIGPPEKLKV